jgi:hypothetical protein
VKTLTLSVVPNIRTEDDGLHCGQDKSESGCQFLNNTWCHLFQKELVDGFRTEACFRHETHLLKVNL